MTTNTNAEQRAEGAPCHHQNSAYLRMMEERNQYAAVLEKVRVYAREMRDRASMNAQQGGEFWQGMTIKGRESADDLDALIASAPADALREVKAAVWDEGYSHCFDLEDSEEGVSLNDNPYRKEQDRG